MRWQQIRVLLESKPIQFSSLALFVVPLTAKFWSVNEESVGLYFAAVLIAIATVVYALRNPKILEVDTLEEAFNRGWNTRALVNQIEEVDMK